LFHGLIRYVDAHPLAFGYRLDETRIDGVNRFDLARPAGFFVGPTQPRGIVSCKFSGEEIALLGRSWVPPLRLKVIPAVVPESHSDHTEADTGTSPV